MQEAACGSFQLMHSSSQDTFRIGYTSLFTRQNNIQIDNVQQMDRLMDAYTGFVKTVLLQQLTGFSGRAATGCRSSVPYRTPAKISHRLAVFEAFTQNSLATCLFTHATAFSRIIVVDSACIAEDKRAQSSTTEVRFSAIITSLSQCMTVITMVQSEFLQAFPVKTLHHQLHYFSPLEV